MGLLDMFSGGAFSQASIFALGIMPYISASIVIQLLTIVFPYFQKTAERGREWQTEDEPVYPLSYGPILVLQAPTYLANITNVLPPECFYSVGTLLYHLIGNHSYSRYYVCNVAG
jgi:preprotein translocase subunit SecY